MGIRSALDSVSTLRMTGGIVIVGTLAIGLAVLVATGAFRAGSGSAVAGASAPAATAPDVTGSPAAPLEAGTLVLGAQAKDLAVGLAVRTTDDGLALQATVLGQDGLPLSGLAISMAAGERKAPAAPCGAGCYASTLAASPPATVEVRIGGPRGRAASFDVPARWEPAKALVRRATRTYRELSSVVYDERLESRPGNAIQTRWIEEAPNRLSFRIAGGNEGIVIGDRRWDRDPGGDWVAAPQEPLSLPEPLWGETFENASLLGSGEVGGRPVSIVSFRTEQGLPTWFTLWIDKETDRTLELHMTTAAHFMVQRFRSFDRPASIVPPS